MEVLNKESRLRYARQIAISQIGTEGQEKLLNSRVLIIGCGALGSMIAMQLAGAGIGFIGIADYDNIDISNLQRQFFFNTNEVGESKAKVLAERIKEFNPEIKLNVFHSFINKKLAEEIFEEYDIIIDASDNPDTKRMTGNIAKIKNKPCCIGGVKDFAGQVMTFLPSDPRFEEYFGESADNNFLPCSLAGVIGPAATFCASVQSAEAIKFLTGTGNLLSGKMFIFDLLTNKFMNFSL